MAMAMTMTMTMNYELSTIISTELLPLTGAA